MKSLSDRIRESLEMFIEEFTQELHTKGKNASGKVSESFVIENMGNGMVLSNGSIQIPDSWGGKLLTLTVDYS